MSAASAPTPASARPRPRSTRTTAATSPPTSRATARAGRRRGRAVVDLIRRRTVSFMNLACCEWRPSIRLASNGTVAVLSPGEGVFVKAPGGAARTLAAEGSGARDLAMHGGTVYWTEGGQARSAGAATARAAARRSRSSRCACAAAAGRAPPRAAARSSPRARCACTRRPTGAAPAGSAARRPIALAGSTPPRIVGDRWVLVFGEGSARVIDTRTGRTVIHETSVVAGDAAARRHARLDRLRRAGCSREARARRPSWSPRRASGLLAAARRAVYWTENGGPRVYRPPSAARSASKPG